ncbi:uncharacterized protein MKK02DRAFT_30812 [Dioszegia hungarica]|uniref:Uncharacterized protein n=1 Tax=Dioszegia hungarica TaxID=4972 RepID=A0AA38H348_9TREE|nr:uncharacterized protein MKK02DRAFT_30812 [Dioszegia hungarica]KAI9631811.1 hypothetical protein MKK02DRAFT_30812 [Dioszegia hungarica]
MFIPHTLLTAFASLLALGVSAKNLVHVNVQTAEGFSSYVKLPGTTGQPTSLTFSNPKDNVFALVSTNNDRAAPASGWADGKGEFAWVANKDSAKVDSVRCNLEGRIDEAVAKDPKNEGFVFTFAAFITSSDTRENCTAQYGVATRPRIDTEVAGGGHAGCETSLTHVPVLVTAVVLAIPFSVHVSINSTLRAQRGHQQSALAEPSFFGGNRSEHIMYTLQSSDNDFE